MGHDMTTNTGGAAFPYAAVHGCNGEYGMTLRDYFAAKAMQGLIASANQKGLYAPPDNELASAAYELADAMLKARQA
jgi:hypothetical protein